MSKDRFVRRVSILAAVAATVFFAAYVSEAGVDPGFGSGALDRSVIHPE